MNGLANDHHQQNSTPHPVPQPTTATTAAAASSSVDKPETVNEPKEKEYNPLAVQYLKKTGAPRYEADEIKLIKGSELTE